MFCPVDTTMCFSQNETNILKFWKDNDIFHKSLLARKEGKHWCFYEGPPTANGKPHPGHVLTRVIKDLFLRYKTMCGYYVPRKAGWDTHGLPVEIEVEKELNLNGKGDIEKYGVETFIRKCVDSVFRYTSEWEQLTERIGFWVDLDTAYVTYHQSYVESVWWSLKQLHEKGILYKGHKILPWCPHCQTALSSHEVGLGYKQIEEPSVYVAFRDVDWDKNKTSFLAWTTTPWTLPSNAGLAIKHDIEYSYVNISGETLIIASALVAQVMGKMKYEVLKKEMGSLLVGRKYQPLFNWVPRSNFKGQEYEKVWTVCAADFVTLDTGSGIVHIAPAFGADDYNLGKKENLPVICLVGTDGKFIENCEKYTGRFVKDADKDIIKELNERKLLLKRENYKHDYPFCWRCDNPLIYFARGGWFIRTTQEIHHVIENNKTIDWHPEHIRNGRFGSFLESNVDWALSRERYWGTPLNIWVCSCGNEESISSFEELKTKPKVKGLDTFDITKQKNPELNEHLRVHKPWIDAITFTCSKCGKEMQRTKEVIDCWYDSGAMPFAQWGYPHVSGSKEMFDKNFPADFISEAIDQTRGWFYSLITESTLLNDSFNSVSGKKITYPHPYKTCLVLGHVCDEKGEKMSKSKSNYLDPNLILDEEGADALRWFFYSSTNPWTSIRFSRSAVRDAQKEFLVKLKNIYSFFVIYANIDGFEPDKFNTKNKQSSLLDDWILSELHFTIERVRGSLDNFDIFSAANTLNTFVESLSNWYVRRSRDRFWSGWQTSDYSSEADCKKLSAYFTLYECLTTLAQLIAPFAPFMAEDIWKNLTTETESVHLCDYPKAQKEKINKDLNSEIALIREIASLGRAARSTAKLKTRQPLSKMIVVTSNATQDMIIEKHKQVLLDEINVKEIEVSHKDEQYVKYTLSPNFKLIGIKYRDLVPEIKAALSIANVTEIRTSLEKEGKAVLQVGDKNIFLETNEVKVSLQAKDGYAATSGNHIVVALDTLITAELQDEGIMREVVSRINDWRSTMKLKYEQKINLAIKGSSHIEDIVQKFSKHICKEILSKEITIGTIPPAYQQLLIEVNEESIILGIDCSDPKL